MFFSIKVHMLYYIKHIYIYIPKADMYMRCLFHFIVGSKPLKVYRFLGE